MAKSTNWYVVRAISGQEKKVKQYIESELGRLGMEHAVEEILIPMEKVFEMRNGKKRTRERSFMPGYIFMQAHLNPEVQAAIQDTPGVIGFLTAEPLDTKGMTKDEIKAKRQPQALRESEVNRLIGKVDEVAEQGEMMDNPYAIGEEVKVMDGPFSGFTGLVEAVDEDKKKLKVMVKIFGRNTPVELNYLQVERHTE